MRGGPYRVISDFETAIAEYAGARHAIAVESCTAAILLTLDFCAVKIGLAPKPQIAIPKNTYPSVAHAIITAGFEPIFEGCWIGSSYQLFPLPVFDCALVLRRGMYPAWKMPAWGDRIDYYQCLSFHQRKHLPIGRGGMILTDDSAADKWLRRARFDGRGECALEGDQITFGRNAYMTPEQAARGLAIFETIKDKELANLRVEDQGYARMDLSRQPYFAERAKACIRA